MATTTRLEAGGLVFRVPLGEKPSSLTKRLERGRLPWDATLTPLLHDRVLLDIGANIGTVSLAAVALGRARRVYAAEPDPENFACLVENIVSNDLARSIFPSRVAISDSCGTAPFRRAPRMANHRLAPTAGPATIEVETRTLDAWVTANGIDLADVGLVKVDVQGWEAHVLRGASEALAHGIPWLIEVSPKHLASAGTETQAFAELLGRHFTKAVEMRRTRAVIQMLDLPALLARLEADRTYTNLLLSVESDTR